MDIKTFCEKWKSFGATQWLVVDVIPNGKVQLLACKVSALDLSLMQKCCIKQTCRYPKIFYAPVSSCSSEEINRLLEYEIDRLE